MSSTVPSSVTLASVTGAGFNGPYTVTTGIGLTYDGNAWATTATDHRTNGKINLDGPNADIEINGRSLVKLLNDISERLNILQVNPGLEKDWKELLALGEQYRALEKQIQEKMKTWEILNK